MITVDSITFEILDSDLEKSIPIIRSSMENISDKIQMKVKMKIGKNLGDMEVVGI